MLFPPGTPSRVPIVAVTGTNGKTTTTRMIAHIMRAAGHHVGMTTTDGIYVDTTQIAAGDMAGARPARKVLCNPSIDYAVLETARGSILRDGLGFAHCDVAVVTNVAADHLGHRGIHTVADMAKVKAVVPRAVAPGGASVLNADDSSTVEMAAVAGGEIMFFSLDGCNPVVRDHLRAGGRAVVLHATEAGEMLTLRDGEEEKAILLAEEIPATMEGRIRVNIANALAATATALAQDVPLATIRTALRSFANSVAQSPGRFNVLAIEGRTVVQDYCHNVHGLEAMREFVQRMKAPHSVAAIYMSGDRTDDHIAAFGRLAAQIFDELIIRDSLPKYRRGRKPGEVPALLQAAALAGGLAPDKVSLARDKLEAADMAMAKSGRDSLVVLLGGADPAAIWNYLMQRHEAETAV
jgi:cyanophycin synthetase